MVVPGLHSHDKAFGAAVQVQGIPSPHMLDFFPVDGGIGAAGYQSFKRPYVSG
ncbi:hypothetical protein ES703_112007 [subsurface metagenome]